MQLQQDQRLTVTQRIDPKIILTNSILQLTSLELIQTIENELLENLALEASEEVGCDGNCIDPNACIYCSLRQAAAQETEAGAEEMDSGDSDYDFENGFISNPLLSGDSSEDFDIVSNTEAETTLQEHLYNQLRIAVDADAYFIGEHLIDCLDEKGWLSDTIENIAYEMDVPVETAERILTVIQSFDPPGIAARNLQECLRLQLEYLRETVDKTSRTYSADIATIDLAITLIRDHFDNFTGRRYPRLARTLKVPLDNITLAGDYIRANLNPFPANQFHSPWVHRPTNSKAAVRPDVIVRRMEFGYDIEVSGTDYYTLSVAPHYRDVYNQIKNGEKRHDDDYSKHVIEYVERADRFIRNIQQRRKTLRQITQCIINYQTGFLETGSRQFIRPLTRTKLAYSLNIHESTVSRATAGKYVQLPNQEVIAFDVFFDASLSTKNAIETLIRCEDPSNPLSDQQIVEMLKEQGITIARRTIMKYRDQEKILSSNLRRR